MPEAPRLIPITVVAQILGKSRRTVSRIADRLPPPVKLPGRRLWKRSDIEAWLSEGCDLRLWRRAKRGE